MQKIQQKVLKHNIKVEIKICSNGMFLSLFFPLFCDMKRWVKSKTSQAKFGPWALGLGTSALVYPQHRGKMHRPNHNIVTTVRGQLHKQPLC